MKNPRLKEGAIPTIFPDIPKSHLKSIPKARKSPKKRLLLCDTQIIQSMLSKYCDHAYKHRSVKYLSKIFIYYCLSRVKI